MSRIGKKLITIADNVTCERVGIDLIIKGPKGELKVNGNHKIDYQIKEKTVEIIRHGNDKIARSLHGLYRSLVNNAITGVTEGYTKTLEMNGVGYRASVSNGVLDLLVGFSHPVKIEAPEGIEFQVEKNTTIHIKGMDKQIVGEMAAKIRKVRPPEPYKGKGIKYSDEIIKRKAGKTAKSGA